MARDLLTYLYDRPKAMETLEAFEKQWGGDLNARMAAKAEAYRLSRQAPIPIATPSPHPEATPPAAGGRE